MKHKNNTEEIWEIKTKMIQKNLPEKLTANERNILDKKK